ncbi:MAG TPA: hypothetical protein VN713_10945 [Sphingomicrobium sp.]|nr:hypothetical protein [Sphingomicrobium sp.]
MSFYRWAMRSGAVILFCASILILVVSFANFFFVEGPEMSRSMPEVAPTSHFVLFWRSVAQALSNSVWSFFGACLLYRLDEHWPAGKGRQ